VITPGEGEGRAATSQRFDASESSEKKAAALDARGGLGSIAAGRWGGKLPAPSVIA